MAHPFGEVIKNEAYEIGERGQNQEGCLRAQDARLRLLDFMTDNREPRGVLNQR